MTAVDRLAVPSWAAHRGVVTRYDGDLTVGGTAHGGDRPEYPSMFGVLLSEEPDDDQLDHLLAVIGYAFRPHMSGLPPIDSGPGVSVHDTLVMTYAPFAQRQNKTRSVDEAFIDMVEMVRKMYQEGSPIRADGNRLIDPYAGDLPDLVDFYVGRAAG